MYEKLEKMRDEVSRCERRFKYAEEKLRVAREKLKECEAEQILSDVGAMNLTPEALGKFLAIIKSGQLAELFPGLTDCGDGKNDDKDEDGENDSESKESGDDKRLSHSTEEVTDAKNLEELNGQNDSNENAANDSEDDGNSAIEKSYEIEEKGSSGETEESDYLDVLNNSNYDSSYDEGYGGYRG